MFKRGKLNIFKEATRELYRYLNWVINWFFIALLLFRWSWWDDWLMFFCVSTFQMCQWEWGEVTHGRWISAALLRLCATWPIFWGYEGSGLHKRNSARHTTPVAVQWSTFIGCFWLLFLCKWLSLSLFSHAVAGVLGIRNL